MIKFSPQYSSNILSSKQLRKRRKAERRFKIYGISAIIFVIFILIFFLFGIFFKGYSALTRTEIALEIYFDPKVFHNHKKNSNNTLKSADTSILLQRALEHEFPDVKDPIQMRKMLQLVSFSTQIMFIQKVNKNHGLIGIKKTLWVLAADDVNQYVKNTCQCRPVASQHHLDPDKAAWVNDLMARQKIRQHFNSHFFTASDSREPKQAGILGALMGSFYTMLITLLIAFPLGIGAAIYLNEFTSKSRMRTFIEVNISNLAAVPSIIFGLLGFIIFLNFMDLPRSSALIGGMTLSLMTMPVIVLTARSALDAVPKSIREAAEALGASRIQLVFHHVIPLAMPGIMTGTILSMARALGESAPLLMIGMVAFIVDVPHTPLDPTSVLPVQIFNWVRNPEQGFVEVTAAAITVLLIFLIIMNTTAIILRKRFQHKW